jgi:hypothetical protein
MSESWRKRVIFGVLVVTLVWGYFALVKPRVEIPVATTESDATVGGPAEPAAVSPPAVSDSLLARYGQAAWGGDPFNRDPFPTTNGPIQDLPSLHLLGILYRQTGAQALINGRIAGVGDVIDGYRIMSITRENVTVQSDRRTVVLRVGKEAS